MSQPKNGSGRYAGLNKSRIESFPHVGARALDSVLEWGDARPLAAAMGMSDAVVSRLRSGEERIYLDEVPKLVASLGPVKGQRFLGHIAEASGYEVAPASAASDDSIMRQLADIGAGFGEVAAGVHARTSDGLFCRQDAAELVKIMDAMIAKAQQMRAMCAEVGDEKRDPIKLHG